MKEQWKLLKEITTTQSQYYIKGDKIYISNTGKIKLNDEVLSIGHGLYVSGKELHIVGMSFPENNMYRTIYKLFTNNLKHGTAYNIHHIDYNHLNNSLDNLLQCTSLEHGQIHSNDFAEGKLIDLIRYNKEIEKLNNQKDIHIKQTKEWLSDRVKEYKKPFELEKQKQKQLRDKQIISKQNEIIYKLLSGEYKRDCNGHLYNTHRNKWTDERRQKFLDTNYNNVYNNPEWRKNISKGVKQYMQTDKYKEDRERLYTDEWKHKVSEGLKAYHKNKKVIQ